MKYTITAQSCNPITGKANAPATDEIIDVSRNTLFKNCKTLTDVVETYQRFWNRLPTIQKELVLVQKITVKK